jgi:HSP90 family molecular chaperone
LAKNLYSSSARFVFELLQNADDNDFSRAIANSEIPHISFRIFPDKVILECNEDGFTSENLRAICAVGRSSKVSSKVGAQGYTGEKGIGFKSVFMVAWQVHIQSNAFSFTFTHRKGDSGIGMISPVWHEPEGNLDGSSTRITLFLHQHDNPDAQEQQYRDIVSQFNELQGTVLLFLRKLQQVRVSFYDKAGNLTSRTHHSLHKTPHVTIRKASLRGDNPEVLEDRLYHVTKHIANNVPPSENKSYADGDHRPDSNTEIVLAFPITDNSVPIVENQDIFAFLPIKKMSFKVRFLNLTIFLCRGGLVNHKVYSFSCIQTS